MVIKAHLDPSPTVFDERREPRRAMSLQTSGAGSGGLEANVTIHNLTSAGLLIETELALVEGEGLVIDLPDIGSTHAQVVWSSGTLFGCRFANPISQEALATAQLQDVLDRAPRGPAQEAPPAKGAAEPFGVRLNRLRRERSMTLAQVADALDVSKPTVWAWEKGKARPLPERIEAIADVLGVSADDLSDSRAGDAGRSVIEDCRLRIATAYGTLPQNIRIMIEV